MRRAVPTRPRLVALALVLTALIALVSAFGDHDTAPAPTAAAPVVAVDAGGRECPPGPSHPHCTHWSALPGPGLRDAAPGPDQPATDTPARTPVVPSSFVTPSAAGTLAAAHSPAALQVFRN